MANYNIDKINQFANDSILEPLPPTPLIGEYITVIHGQRVTVRVYDTAHKPPKVLRMAANPSNLYLNITMEDV